jgi:site-specific DNA-adenine methylase
MISYIGGKARIGKWIVPQIPTDIETYVEGFSGMFWVFSLTKAFNKNFGGTA